LSIASNKAIQINDQHDNICMFCSALIQLSVSCSYDNKRKFLCKYMLLTYLLHPTNNKLLSRTPLISLRLSYWQRWLVNPT